MDVTFPLRMREYWYASAAMSAMNFCVASARSRDRWRGVCTCACAGRAAEAPFMPFVGLGGLVAPFMPLVWGKAEEVWGRGFVGMAELRVVVVEAEWG